MSEFVPHEDDLTWLIQHLPINAEDKEKVKLTLVPFTNTGGMNCTLKKVKMEIDDTVEYFVWKTIGNLQQSIQLGLPREALFYQQFGEKVTDLGIHLPVVYYAYGNMKTGEKVMVFEDLSNRGTQSGHFFGHHSPLNWGKDLELLTQPVTHKPTEVEVVRDAFIQAAKLHREFWLDKELLAFPWLRSSAWLKGEFRQAWDISQQLALTRWGDVKKSIEAGTRSVKWDENILKCIEASMAKISWDNYQKELAQRKWTLVHGDFHPANIFWVNGGNNGDGENSQGMSLFLDWEMVAVGSGPQDLAQYFISHIPGEKRREMEDILLHEYYQALTSNESIGGKFVNPENYSYEEMLNEFAHGGAEKWIWLITVCAEVFNDQMLQYFQDQMADFFKDHGLNEHNIGMPRVN
jgi:hypothetical protein